MSIRGAHPVPSPRCASLPHVDTRPQPFIFMPWPAFQSSTRAQDAGARSAALGTSGRRSQHAGGTDVRGLRVYSSKTHLSSRSEKSRSEQKYCAPCEDRTHDLQIMRLTRYLLR